MTQLCLTGIAIAALYCATRIIIKKMELSFMDRKNQKEGKYINCGGDPVNLPLGGGVKPPTERDSY